MSSVFPPTVEASTTRRGLTMLLVVGLWFVQPVSAQPDRIDARPPEPPALPPCTSAAQPLVARSAVPARPPHGHLSASTRWGVLREALLDPGFILESAGAGIGAHLEEEPSTWPDGMLGLTARVGSHTGAALLNVGVTHGLAAGTGLDVRFVPRGHGALGPRLRYAVLETVTAQRPDGTRVPNLPRMAGGFTAALAQTRWERGDWRPGRAVLSAALSLGIDLVVNVTTELVQSTDAPDRDARTAPIRTD